MLDRRFRATSDGVVVGLAEDERSVLGFVLDQFRELLMMESDPNLIRLRPPAYPADPSAERDYREMVGDQLLRQRLEAIENMERGLDGATLDHGAVTCWLQTLTGVRLYLGERLDVGLRQSVDDDDPDAESMALYQWLGWLLEQLVEAAEQAHGLAKD